MGAQMGNYLQQLAAYRRESELIHAHRLHFDALVRREEALAVFRLTGVGAKLAVWLAPLTRRAVCAMGSMVIFARSATSLPNPI